MDQFNQQLVKTGHHSQLESHFILLQVQIHGDEKSGGEIRIAPAVQWLVGWCSAKLISCRRMFGGVWPQNVWCRVWPEPAPWILCIEHQHCVALAGSGYMQLTIKLCMK